VSSMSGFLIQPEPSRRIIAIVTALRKREPDANVIVDDLLSDMSERDLKMMVVSLAGLWVSAVEILVSETNTPPDAVDRLIEELALQMHDGLPRKEG